MHLVRYPTRHAGLLHYSLKSYFYVYTALYTSLILSLGFKEHTVDPDYLYNSISQSTETCILLVNSGARIQFDFLTLVYRSGTLARVLSGITTSRIITVIADYDDDGTCDCEGCERMRTIIDNELARRHIK